MAQQSSQSLFPDISGETEPTVMESLCVNCGAQGKTTILLTKIPFFQEVIVVSFYCDQCGYKNSELQPAGALKDQGVRIKLKLIKGEDLNRDVVKSEHCVLRIPELDLEIPASGTKGRLNTIEGFLDNTIDDLKMDQDQRKEQDPETHKKIEEYITKLEQYRDGFHLPFTLELDDPSGNSFIKNPYAPTEDPQMKISYYNKTIEQLVAMGYSPENTLEELKQKEQAQKTEKTEPIEEQKKEEHHISAHKVDFSKPLVEESNVKEEALSFPTVCHACGLPGVNQMCTISVPYFKELIIMSFSCDNCGAKAREVKVGGEVSEKAKRITLKVESEEDLKRDLFKSETAVLKIPEIDLELGMGTLGGVYTTVEGLIEKISDHMKDNNPFVGDSSQEDFKEKMEKFYADLDALREVKFKWTLILDDAMDNSFIQNPYHPKDDPRVSVELYDRTWEQNEELGLNDMKTENYDKKQA